MAQWYILYNGQQVGPMEEDQLVNYDLNPNSQVWCEGMPQWVAAFTIPALMNLINENRQRTGQQYGQQPGCPPMAPGYADYSGPTSGKDKTAAGILAILLGGFGAQYFYIGKIGGAFLTILLSFVTCGLWTILMFVQGIMMLTMSQQEFDRKYVNTNSTLPLF